LSDNDLKYNCIKDLSQLVRRFEIAQTPTIRASGDVLDPSSTRLDSCQLFQDVTVQGAIVDIQSIVVKCWRGDMNTSKPYQMTKRAKRGKKKMLFFSESTYPIKMLPEIYNNHLTTYLKKSEYLILLIMVELVQAYRKTRLEELANHFPSPILFESRRKKLKRFFEISCLTIEGVWIPIIKQWLKQSFSPGDVLHIAIDRTQWGLINILMVSLVIDKRGIPLYFELLEHTGNSNFDIQKRILSRVLPLLNEYKTVVLGDREFCSVELGKWLNGQKNVYYALRLKKSTYIEVEKEIWERLSNLGLSPGMSFKLKIFFHFPIY
jgi:hypothetical protein